MKLNLACGNRKIEGWVNVDWSPRCHPDVCADILTQTYWDTLAPDSVEAIEMRHFIEHIPHAIPGTPGRDGLIWFMERVWTALQSGGLVEIWYPHHHHDGAYSDPTHCRFIGQYTLWYFSKTWRDQNDLGHYEMDCDFDVMTESKKEVHPPYAQMPREMQDKAEKMYWNTTFQVQMTLQAVKPCRG